MDIQSIITTLGLEPHPIEGGFFRETYRSKGEIAAEVLPACYQGPRAHSTAIYYLLTPDTFSELHRLPTDEVFHFYLGDPVEMLQLHEDGTSGRYVLGPDISAGQLVQLVVPAQVWQGCRLRAGGRFALLGCTVAPGFDYADYESGERHALIETHPDEQEFIVNLTTESP